MLIFKSGANVSIRKCMVRMLGAALLISPMLGFAAGDLLLNEDSLAAKIAQEPNFQLLDARGAEARHSAPLAFSTKYEKVMLFKKGLVFVVAESDTAALQIAQSIPAGSERSVFAVKGGADAWKRVQVRTATAVAPTGFIVPKGTCELGAPSLKFDAKPHKKAGKAAHKPLRK